MNSKPTICLELEDSLTRNILRSNLEADRYELEADPNEAELILEEVEERRPPNRRERYLRLRRPGCSGAGAPSLRMPFHYAELLELLREHVREERRQGPTIDPARKYRVSYDNGQRDTINCPAVTIEHLLRKSRIHRGNGNELELEPSKTTGTILTIRPMRTIPGSAAFHAAGWTPPADELEEAGQLTI